MEVFFHEHTFSKIGEMQDLKVFEHTVLLSLIPRQFEENYYLFHWYVVCKFVAGGDDFIKM